MTTSTKELSTAWQICLMVMLAVAAVMAPDFALANGGADTNIGSTLCKAVQMITGNTGKGLATIAVVVIGIGALLGKVSWGMAILVGVGVGIIFGAGTIVNAFAAGGAGC
jgi:type IV secretion system protein VirB2